MNKISLGNKIIGDESDPYIIAEIGVNHEGSIDAAINLIELAAKGGANAAKFQTYKASKLAIQNSPAYWDLNEESTKSQHELFSKYDKFDCADYERLAEVCKDNGVDFLSTPFDLESVDFLDPLVPFFKIASADITNIPLLRRVAAKGKPVIISTGASTIGEIASALNELNRHGSKEIALLHCVLNYPTPNERAYLGTIQDLKERFPNTVVGYSDHTVPDDSMFVVTTAISMGARIIEKHFTDDRSKKGNDHYHSMDQKLLIKLCNNVSKLGLISKKINLNNRQDEFDARRFARRGIYLNKSIKKGHKLTESDLVTKRPAQGITSEFWDRLIGLTALSEINADTPLAWTDFK